MPTDIYYIFFPNDRIGMKALGMMFSPISIDFGRRPLTSRLPLSVYWVFILDIFLTVVAAGMGWHILAAGWGRQHNLIEPGWTFSAIAAGDGISTSSFACLSLMASPYLFNPPLVAMTVQFFYAWRIWVIKGWRVIPATIVLVRNLPCLPLVRRVQLLTAVNHPSSDRGCARCMCYFNRGRNPAFARHRAPCKDFLPSDHRLARRGRDC